MTQEDEKILLKVLSEQFSYGVLILDTAVERYGKLYQINSDFVWYDCQETGEVECQSTVNVKPYLRPMSSMTEEEENEYKAINCYEGLFPRNEDALDYVLSNHFDYRGLIPMGLALEAPEGMYKTE